MKKTDNNRQYQKTRQITKYLDITKKEPTTIQIIPQLLKNKKQERTQNTTKKLDKSTKEPTTISEILGKKTETKRIQKN